MNLNSNENLLSSYFSDFDIEEEKNTLPISNTSNESRPNYDLNSPPVMNNVQIGTSLNSTKYQMKLNNEFINYDPNERFLKPSKNFSSKARVSNSSTSGNLKYMPEFVASNIVDNVLKQKLKYQI
jgi:hypothetical protein